MTTTILTDRLAALPPLLKGGHDTPEDGMCVMEAAAFIAGEPHSYHPACVCPVITKFLVSWNDSLPTNEDRDRLLKPLLTEILSTRANKDVEAIRSKMALDWFISEYTPAWLDLAGLKDEASALRASPTLEHCIKARDSAAAAWSAAEFAAWSDAWSAARSAAWSAARSSAESAAWSAARSAAWSAAWSAARSAAWSAAWSAAESAAWSALLPTVRALQESAVALVRKMIAARE